MAVGHEKLREQIQKLKQYLPESTNEELEEILRYGEEMKKRGLEKKKNSQFWGGYTSFEFTRLLRYRRKHQKELEKQYKYLDKMDGIEREKFIEEYLYDDMLYGCVDAFQSENNKNAEDNNNCEHWKDRKVETKNTEYSYNDRKSGKVKIEEGTVLEFSGALIGGGGIEEISKIALKDSVCMNLRMNRITDDGAILIAKNLKLISGVILDLGSNQIGDEGAEAISRMKLEEGVCIRLNGNQIGDEGAQAIIDNMKFKDGVHIDLRNNRISYEMKEKLRKFCCGDNSVNFVISV